MVCLCARAIGSAVFLAVVQTNHFQKKKTFADKRMDFLFVFSGVCSTFNTTRTPTRQPKAADAERITPLQINILNPTNTFIDFYLLLVSLKDVRFIFNNLTKESHIDCLHVVHLWREGARVSQGLTDGSMMR